MKKFLILLSLIVSIAQAQGQLLRDDFNRVATTDISGSLKWKRVLNQDDTSATIQLNADSTVSPRNLLGPLKRAAAYWDSALSGGVQVGMILRHKNGNDGVPSFYLHLMDDSNWATGDGYALRFQTNPGWDRMDIQRVASSVVDTPVYFLLATLNREFSEGDTLMFKAYPNGTKTAVVYGIDGARDSISVVDTVYRPAAWYAWIQGRVFSDPIRMDDFMAGPIPYPITATAGPGGSIAPAGIVMVDPGASQSFTITPDPGFFILDVKVDTVSVGGVGGYTFDAVNAPHSIEAFFDSAEYTITASAGPNGVISPDGAVLVKGGSNKSFTITPNTGYHIDSVIIDGVNQGAPTNYTFTYVTAGHTIAAYFSINSYSITASASAGGSITPSGSVSVSHGSNQSFTITPTTGYHIDSVKVDGVNQGALTSYTFTNVTAGHTIAAYFSINTYTITATASAGGTISPSGAVSVTHGANQSFTISPTTGYHIDSVKVDGANQGAISSYTFTNVTAGHTIAAYFSVNTYTITTTASAGGTISPIGAVSVTHGANQSFTITPNPGYHIDSVKVDGVNQGALTSYTFTNVTAGHTIAAYFSINTYTVTAGASSGGSIFPFGVVNAGYGDDPSFTITPNTGSHIDSVVVDGVDQGIVTSYTFSNIAANHTIQAYFSIDAFTIEATALAGGGITPSGSVGVNYGANRSFAITPNAGHHIDSLVVDGVNLGALANYTFTNVTANHAIAAWFSIDVLTINASASGGGSISPSGTVNVNYGASQTFTVTPDTGYRIDSVLVDGVSQGALTSYPFTNVTAGHTIAAYFSINTYTITASAFAGGSITPSGSVSVNYGANRSFTIAPNTGYHVDSVVVDDVNQGALTTYDFTNVTENHSIAAYFSIDVLTITATAGSGGSISPSGAVPVNYGSAAAFTIVPDAGRHIDSVVVDGVNRGPVTSWQFDDVTAAHTIAAWFSINSYTITAIQSPNGAITPAGATQVAWGDSLSYAIVPDAGYYVAALHIDTATVPPAESYTFDNVTSDHAISATFAVRTFTITTTASAGGGVSPQGAITAEWGDTVTITMLPAVGHHVDSVVVDGVNLGPIMEHSFEGITSSRSLAAYFSIDVFTITASAGPGGTISPAGSVPVAYAGTQAFTVTPSVGYRIDSVLVDGANTGPVASYTFTDVKADRAIQAFFSLRTFIIFASAGGGGSIAPAGATVVTWGDSLTVTITPDTGYHIDSVIVDGVNTGSAPLWVFRDIQTDHVVGAFFSETAFTITAAAFGSGSITPSGPVGVSYGGASLFTMTPSAGSHLDSVLVDGVNIGVPATYRFLNITANHTIAAYFSINYYTLTSSAGPGGMIAPSGSVVLVHGSSQSYTITPDTGYRIQDVLVDGVSVGQPATYSFANLSAGHSIRAVFARITFSINATPGPNGLLSPAGLSTVAYGDSLTYTITPNPGFYVEDVSVDGLSIGIATTYTFWNVTADHSISATFTSNARPTAFALVSPADGMSVPPAALRALRFVWRKSFDANPGDALKYVLTLTGPNVNFNSFEITDTAVTLDLRGLAIVNLSPYRWTVRVTDGTVTVASTDTFDITIDPATTVGGGGGDLPREFALGQNYPNPFNPATSVPFDLPERSDVTLKVFNVIGAEVAALADGESIPAGSHVRVADFSGLPSGVYFCRMSATGESGTAFGKTVRLVLMR